MELFCVRSKPRYFRGCQSRKEDRKGEKKSSIIYVEARLRAAIRNPTETRHNLTVMVHPNVSTESLASSQEQHSRYSSCRSHLLGPLVHNSSCNHDSDSERGRPGRPAHDNSPQLPQVSQVYVHPYSTHHYRFPVVDHSTTCHGHRLTPCPVYYTALVPEVAAIQDVVAALVDHPGQVGMVRLLGTDELVHLSTFHCIRILHEVSLQLEVWDSVDLVNRV
ncbi:hypothetical protein F5B22DRAFT_273709 [Xylaria bambusicola]|uniref:uncharacterized protein n=1 Tax=Xylaria bambusicola TaxID=326684 RepID=UPI00200833E7|nr:uncharacterized protein F5B22DRAFT_273709 [Xylaria bambusicola]KAI0513135.1 hypothetical protein F5B22DRAFT_273709 [Xylaria bambusicola]